MADIYGIHPIDPRFDIDVPKDPTAYIYKLATNYLFFASELWKQMGWDKHHRLTRVELDILHFAAYGPDRRGILAPRGLGKSHLVAVTLPLYRFMRDPQRKVLEPSKSRDEAKKNAGLIRSILNSVWFLKELSPGESSLDTSNAFELSCALPHRQPSLVAIGIEGHLQGNRAHTIIPDDIEIDENTRTKEARDDLAHKVNEFESILYVESPTDGRPLLYDRNEICYIGTYNHEDSVYLKEAELGFLFQTWPLIYPDAKDKVLNLSPMLRDDLESGRAKPGDLVFPHRFDQDYVAKKLAKGLRYFNMQHKLVYETPVSDRYPLKLEHIFVDDLDPVLANCHYVWGRTNGSDNGASTTAEHIRSVGFADDNFRKPVFKDKELVPYIGTHVWIDPAGMGSDKVGFAAVASLNGFLFVKKCLGLPGGYSESNLNTLAEWCREVRATQIFIEYTAGGGMFDTLFAPVLQRHYLEPYTTGGDNQNPAYADGWKCSISTDTKITHSTKQKETRIIDSLEPVLGSHRLVFDTSAALNSDLQYQITRITREPKCLDHYDELDALSGAVRSWQYSLSLDTEQAARRSREAAFLERIERFNARAVHANAGGTQTNWAKRW